MGAQANPVGVGDAHSGRHHVVDHPGKLVDAVDRHRSATTQGESHLFEALDSARTVVCPHHVGQRAEHPGQAQSVRFDQAVGQQMQPQISVESVRRGIFQGAGHGPDGDHFDTAVGVRAAQRRKSVRNLGGSESGGSGRVVGAQFGFGEPGVQHGAVLSEGGKSETRGGSHGATR